MPTHSNMNESRKIAGIPVDERPGGADPNRGAESGDRKSESSSGERQGGQAREQQQQGGAGQPSSGLKDKDAPTGDTPDSGDPASR